MANASGVLASVRLPCPEGDPPCHGYTVDICGCTFLEIFVRS